HHTGQRLLENAAIKGLTEDRARSPVHRFRNFLPHGRQPQKTLSIQAENGSSGRIRQEKGGEIRLILFSYDSIFPIDNSINRSNSSDRRLTPFLIFSNNRRSRSMALTVFNWLSTSAERFPCFHAFRLPLGAPPLVPPCIRQRFRPLTAGDWQGFPDRVLAPHRGALARFSGCMGLSVELSNISTSVPTLGYRGTAKLNFFTAPLICPPQTPQRNNGGLPMFFNFLDQQHRRP
ncbi:hypothetical protein OSJ57_25455, partial [Sphingomonas sp. HH69]